MITVTLNVRGLSRPEKRTTVRRLVKKHKVDVLLLQETKVALKILSIIRDIWGNSGCAWDWVPSVGASGGLITIWKEGTLHVDNVLKS